MTEPTTASIAAIAANAARIAEFTQIADAEFQAAATRIAMQHNLGMIDSTERDILLDQARERMERAIERAIRFFARV